MFNLSKILQLQSLFRNTQLFLQVKYYALFKNILYQNVD